MVYGMDEDEEENYKKYELQTDMGWVLHNDSMVVMSMWMMENPSMLGGLAITIHLILWEIRWYGR